MKRCVVRWRLVGRGKGRRARAVRVRRVRPGRNAHSRAGRSSCIPTREEFQPSSGGWLLLRRRPPLCLLKGVVTFERLRLGARMTQQPLTLSDPGMHRALPMTPQLQARGARRCTSRSVLHDMALHDIASSRHGARRCTSRSTRNTYATSNSRPRRRPRSGGRHTMTVLILVPSAAASSPALALQWWCGYYHVTPPSLAG